MKAIYGVDLGTTYSKCAVIRPPENRLQIFKLDRESRRSPQNSLEILRSAVAVAVDESGRRIAHVGMPSFEIVGEWDEENDAPLRFFEESKIWIGEDATGQVGDPPPWPFPAHEWHYRPEDVGAIVLRKIKREVEAAHGPPMDRIVLTHPQYFNDTRRKATRDAAEIAGLEVVDTLTEPDAAALAFALEASAGKYMIFDLGGGTLDVTVAEMGGGKLRVVASDGLKMGGRDFDRLIYQRMVEEYCALYGEFEESLLDDRTRQDWMQRAESAKRALNTPDQPSIGLKFCCDNRFFQGQTKKMVIKRTDFFAAAQGIVDDCVRTAEAALEQGGLRWPDLAGVVSVGASTMLEPVRETLARVSGGKVVREGVDRCTAIAQGAALHAHRLASGQAESTARSAGEARSTIAVMELVGVLARGLGVRAYSRQRGADVVVNLASKGSALPTEVNRTFRTTNDGDTAIDVSLYEGEDDDPELCCPLGSVRLTGFRAGPAGQPVDVTIRIDANGTKHILVSAFGRSQEAVIEFDPSRVVPRDDLPRRRAFIQSLVVL